MLRLFAFVCLIIHVLGTETCEPNVLEVESDFKMEKVKYNISIHYLTHLVKVIFMTVICK